MAHNVESISKFQVAELSISFRDELTASIQSAFGVAGELVVAEVSKVVGKALRDVREQLQKTLLANRSLQSRLSLAQSKLSAARSRTPETRQTRDIAVNTSPIPSEHRNRSLLGVKETYNDAPSDLYVRRMDSFCAIQVEGIECSQDVKPSLAEQSSHQFQDTDGIKEDYHSMQENDSHPDKLCFGAGMAPGASAVQIKGCISFESVNPIWSDTKQEFSSNSMSVAQSKLLHDWRPEPRHLQGCQSAMYTSSIFSALENPSSLQENQAGVTLNASASCSQPDMCHAPPSWKDSSSLNNPAPDLHFFTDSSGQGQAIGQFPIPEDSPHYRCVLQAKPASNQHKTPSRNLDPSGRSPFRCSQCGRDFNRMEHLKIHQRIHTGEKPYVCIECTARFRHSWALTRHYRIHTGEKPYLCTQCGKSFRNCGSLRFHQRTHAWQSGLTNIIPNVEDSGKA